MTYDVIIIIKTFYMSNHTNGENFVSIHQVVAEKTQKFCADKQTDKHNTLSFREGNNYAQTEFFF